MDKRAFDDLLRSILIADSFWAAEKEELVDDDNCNSSRRQRGLEGSSSLSDLYMRSLDEFIELKEELLLPLDAAS